MENDNSLNCSSDIITNGLLAKDSMNVMSKNKQKCRNAGICTKEKCVRSITKRLPPIRQPDPKNEEAWGVKSLPTNWVPLSKPSKVIENLMKKRQTQHEAIINQIKNQFQTINLDIEAQIRLNSELLKHDFADIENETRKCIETLDVDSTEMLALNKENFEKAAKIILDLHKKQTTKIETFHVFLQELEKLRASKFKNVLKSAYEELHKISYELPYKIQQYFEHEILQINQVLLSNLRCYADLKLQLNLQAENSNRLHLQNLDIVREKWREIKKTDALIKLNEKKLILHPDCEALLLETETDAGIIVKEHSMEEIWTHLSPLQIRTRDVKVWTSCMQCTINELDACARKLITLYKMAVVKVFSGYLEELQNLTESMLEMGLVDTAEISVLSLDVCKPTIESVTRHYSCDLINLEKLWDSLIINLQMKLQNTYVFLHGAGHLWDSHYQRLAEAKRIVLKDLKKIIEKNNEATQDQEIKLNIALDQLRQAASEAELEDDLDDVNDLLDILKKAYNSHYANEIKIVEKYYALAEIEVEALSAELTLFLHVHPKDTERNPTVQKRRASQCSSGDGGEGWILPQQMKQCEYQVAAVENWMFGLWEAIGKYVSTCKEEMIQQAEGWVFEQTKKLAKRLEIKMAFHTSRYSRIKINVYDIRLAELKTHSGRLARHKAGAEKEIEDIKQFYVIYETQFNNIIEDYKKKIEYVKSKLVKAGNETAVTAYIKDLNYNTNLCNQKINNVTEQQDATYNLKLYTIRKTAVDFCKQIKLFLETGNFNCEEAKIITKDLKTFEKTIKKKFNIINKEIQTKQKKLFQQVQYQETESLHSLNYSLEEFKFYENEKNRIKRLQTYIRTEVYNIKILNKKLESSIQELEKKRLLNLGDITYLDQFERNLNEAISSMFEINNYLYQLEPVINASKKDLQHLMPETAVQQTNTGPGTNLINYANLLFENIPTESESFMSKICFNLYTSLMAIQSEAQDFYKKHGEITNKGKIQPSYDEFMKEVFAKYNFYHLQCELLWLELVNGFLKMLQNLQSFACTYRKEFTEQHYNLHSETFMGKHKQLVAELTTIKDNNKQLFHQIYEKLKPLHGYRNNKYLLEELQKEMAETIKQLRNFDITDVLYAYKKGQEEQANIYQWEFHEVDDKLALLCNESFGELLHSPLIQQFGEKLVHMTDLLNEELSEQPEEQPASEEEVYHDQMKTMVIPSEYQTNLANIQALQQEFAEDTFFTGGEEEYVQKYEFLEKFNEEHTQNLADADDIESTWYADVDNYEKMFEASVQKILKLYTVKYDNPVP